VKLALPTQPASPIPRGVRGERSSPRSLEFLVSSVARILSRNLKPLLQMTGYTLREASIQMPILCLRRVCGRWCLLCEHVAARRWIMRLKSLPDRPIQQAISSQA
jgi:hypothetical protein